MLEDLADAGKELDVDVVFAEDFVGVGAGAAELFREPYDGMPALTKLLPDPAADVVVLSHKKVRNPMLS